MFSNDSCLFYGFMVGTNFICRFLIEEWKFLKESKLPPAFPIADNIWENLSRRIVEKVMEVQALFFCLKKKLCIYLSWRISPSFSLSLLRLLTSDIATESYFCFCFSWNRCLNRETSMTVVFLFFTSWNVSLKRSLTGWIRVTWKWYSLPFYCIARGFSYFLHRFFFFPLSPLTSCRAFTQVLLLSSVWEEMVQTRGGFQIKNNN